MNAKNLFAAVSLFAAAGSVLAEQTYPFVEFTNVPSTRTRAEVIAEIPQRTVTSEFVEHVNVPSTRTRAEVVAEIDHSSPRSHPEFVEFTRVVSTRSRAEVRAEAIQAARDARGNTAIGG